MTCLGNVLKDLVGTTQAAFNSEANAWTASSLVTVGVKTCNCAGTYVLRGCNILGGSKGEYFQRYYTGLPTPHNLMVVSFLFYQMDSWDGSCIDDHFEISFEGTAHYAWRLSGFADMRRLSVIILIIMTIHRYNLMSMCLTQHRFLHLSKAISLPCERKGIAIRY